ncbi:MAG: MBOAT family protein [Microcoleus vaginatus WJT46-NPBG5]|jgi:alginate O-acetyltransferase complex protein AlgI|nr:MBOAT family protein [Microcoleus vaginatus WJT46-NPBG5]
MLFNSSIFIIFLLITFCIYYIPQLQKIQVPILISASFIFYGWSSPALLILLLVSILINGITSYKVANASQNRERFFWALLGVVTNLSILALFKYGALLTNLSLKIFNASTTPEEGLIALLLNLPLPIGISFYTFQGISLVVDVFRHQDLVAEGTTLPARSFVNANLKDHLVKTSFFLAFFPQLVAGPIVTANDFYDQIKPKFIQNIPWPIVFRSLVYGYFLKMVVADNLKDYTFWINYPYYQGLGTVTNLVLLFGYSMQIFADFAGYSLIAIGLGAAFGYTLPENFNFPYISRSLSEFWRRWHISLSTWLRDYLYIPLGGNRKGEVRTYINLMVVMTLGGLWHGAAWSYAVWGIFHGIGLALERFFFSSLKSSKKPQDELPAWKKFAIESLQVLSVFCFVSLGWLLFKLPRFDQAMDFLVTLSRNIWIKPDFNHILPVFIFSLPVILYHLPHFPTLQTSQAQSLNPIKRRRWRLLEDVVMGIMLALLILNKGSANEFIYFQF